MVMVLIQIPCADNYESELSMEPEKTVLTAILCFFSFNYIQAETRDTIMSQIALL